MDKAEIATGVRKYELEDEMMVYAPGTEAVVTLNASARQIWELCDGTRTAGAICDELGRRFDLPAVAFSEDVMLTLDELRDKGLITPARSAENVQD